MLSVLLVLIIAISFCALLWFVCRHYAKGGAIRQIHIQSLQYNCIDKDASELVQSTKQDMDTTGTYDNETRSFEPKSFQLDSVEMYCYPLRTRNELAVNLVVMRDIVVKYLPVLQSSVDAAERPKEHSDAAAESIVYYGGDTSFWTTILKRFSSFFKPVRYALTTMFTEALNRWMYSKAKLGLDFVKGMFDNMYYFLRYYQGTGTDLAEFIVEIVYLFDENLLRRMYGNRVLIGLNPTLLRQIGNDVLESFRRVYDKTSPTKLFLKIIPSLVSSVGLWMILNAVDQPHLDALMQLIRQRVSDARQRVPDAQELSHLLVLTSMRFGRIFIMLAVLIHMLNLILNEISLSCSELKKHVLQALGHTPEEEEN
jgi:hypothetical protein